MHVNVRNIWHETVVILLTHRFIGQPFEVKSTWSVCLVSERVRAAVAPGLEK